MIRVLIVEDSPVAREYLVYIFSSDPGIRVVGTAADGMEAVRLAERLKPDVITMDIHMPVMNGLEATRRIMETHPVPIVIVSGIWDPKEVETTFQAIEAGALAVVRRPDRIGRPESSDMERELLSKVKLMSEVRVVRRWFRSRQGTEGKQEEGVSTPMSARSDIGVIAVGASTGGPVALRTILAGLPWDFPVPLLIVQHIATGFIEGMVGWLSEVCRLKLHVARDGEMASAGNVYFAPDAVDMGVDRNGLIHLQKEGTQGVGRPTVSHLFRSVAEGFGERSAGVLLTGMGRDGAPELKIMKEKGAITIIQDRESSVIFGMPGAARELGAAMYELPPEKIASALIHVVGYPGRKNR